MIIYIPLSSSHYPPPPPSLSSLLLLAVYCTYLHTHMHNYIQRYKNIHIHVALLSLDLTYCPSYVPIQTSSVYPKNPFLSVARSF